MSTPPRGSATPILDLIAPLPESRRVDRLNLRQALLIVGIPLLAIFLIVFTVAFLDIPAVTAVFNYVGSKVEAFFNAFGREGPLAFTIVNVVTIFLAIGIHEFGHLVAGRSVGFSFEAIRIGPVAAARTPYGMKLVLRRLTSLDGVSEMQIGKLRKVRRRLVIFIAGGPVANLISGLCFSLFLLPEISKGLSAAARHSLQLFVAYSILMAVGNLAPFRRRNGMFTDGARLLGLVNSKLKTRRWLCILALNMQIHSGARLGDLKQTWLAHCCALPDGSSDALQAFWLAYLAANGRKDVEQAEQYLEKCLRLFGIASPSFKTVLLIEAAIFHAWFFEDEKRAAIWFRKIVLDKTAPFLNGLRLGICLHWVAGRYENANSAWEKGWNYLKQLPPSPATESLKQAWQVWKNEMQERQIARTSSNRDSHTTSD